MANICDNTFHACGSSENLQVIKDFLEEKLSFVDIDWYDVEEMDACFESKWTFPEEIMQELYEKIPDKDDIYMRCLSVEYGFMYHALWECDEDGWKEV